MAATAHITPARRAQALADLDQAANLQRLLAQMSGRALSLLIDLAIDAKDEQDGDTDLESVCEDEGGQCDDEGWDSDSEPDIDHIGYRWSEGPDTQWRRHTRFNMERA